MSLVESIEDVELISKSLHSNNPKVKSHALETLERTCSPSKLKDIAFLIDNTPHKAKIQNLENKSFQPLRIEQIINSLKNSPSAIDQIIVATFASQLNLESWKEHLKNQLHKHDKVFYHFAHELIGNAP